jgi:RNA polymerase sigma-70 factor (ECF subfamily)
MGIIDRPPSHALDEYLVIECQLGNSEALTALVRRWHGRLVVRAQELTNDREAALDVVQESWLGIVRGLPRLRDPGRFRPWAMSIVANKARDWIRRERRRRGVAAAVHRDMGQEERAPDHDLERVRDGLAGLEPGQRALLRRYYLEGRSVAEIASDLAIPEGTVKSRLSNARNQLRLRLEED